MNNNQIHVAIGVLILHGSNILLGKRKKIAGNGRWTCPGGHLEFGETWEQCAQREVAEETGLLLMQFKLCSVANDIFMDTNTHYINILMVSEYQGGIITNCEPEKCEGWQWFSLYDLPQPLLIPLDNFTKLPAFQELLEKRNLKEGHHSKKSDGTIEII